MHEINLLPPSRRQRLRRQWLQVTFLQLSYHLQVVLLFVTVVGAVTGVLLQISLVFSSADDEAQLIPLVRQYQLIRQQVTKKNDLVEEAERISRERVVWSNRLAELLEAVPPGTTIGKIQSTQTPPQVVFSGAAVNRNSLIILQSRLQDLPWATKVDAPLQNLLAKDNPTYSFTIQAAK